MRSITIQRGCTSLTGGWSTSWYVSIPGQPGVRCRYLSDALAAAMKHGASGKWDRKKEPIGPRGKMCMVYREQKDPVSP